MKKLITLLAVLSASVAVAREYHVALTGDDANAGTKSKPFKTIQAAANVAMPSDTIIVHAGTYREHVNPPRGGTSDRHRITYQATAGEKVVITGSEPVKGWEKVSGDTWKVVIPNKIFGSFNPYADKIHGDWCVNPRGQHSGAVYLNGDWLIEATKLDDVLKPAGTTLLWFSKVDAESTTIWAQLPGVNPNEGDVEINVRKTVFTPEKTGINYITVRGFTLRNAATNWAPPTAGQIGLVSAYWNKGWIIENNDIGYSTCSGVALGKYSDEWDNRAESAEGYVGTLTRALSNGWNRATIGSHLVRNNHIHHCEQTGVVGSLGCSFSTVTGNDIHDCNIRRFLSGAEMGGIKFHGAIDVVISNNHIYNCGGLGAIWLDWMAQGAQVVGNLLHDNVSVLGDFFPEMQHGPMLVANNLFLSRHKTAFINSQGIAFAHNLIAGPIDSCRGDDRVTPFQKPHATEIAGMHPARKGDSGDHRFYNNLFVAGCNLHALDKDAMPCFADGNVFTKGTQPSKFDTNALVKADFDAGMKLERKADGWYLKITEDKAWRNEVKRRLVTTALLGNAKVPNCAYENPDGSPVKIDRDYLGKRRNTGNPFPGPFEISKDGTQMIKVWPK